jgi:membrane protein
MNTKGISSWWAIAILVARESIRSFSRNRNLEAAATLAYYGFLTLMPLLLVLIFLLGWLAESSEAVLGALRGLLADMFPAFDERILGDLATLAGRRVWGVVSVLVLIWSMTPFAGAARHAVVHIFKGEHRPAFFREKAIDLAVVLALMLLFVGLTAGRLLFSSVSGPPAGAIGALRAGGAFGLGIGTLAIFYKAFAPVRLRWREAAAGAGVAVALLAIIRPLFALLLLYNPNYGYAFGSLKAIFVLIVWVYYTFAVLLFGAEVSANMRRREALLLRGFLSGEQKGPPPMSGKLLEQFVRRPEQGTLLFREGDAGNEMFFIRTGAVRLTRGAVELRVMREGDYFGEMSMLLGAPRTATAEVVAPDTELIAIAERNLETILQENPAVVRRLLKDMAARLQSMNQRIAG